MAFCWAGAGGGGGAGVPGQSSSHRSLRRRTRALLTGPTCSAERVSALETAQASAKGVEGREAFVVGAGAVRW